MIQPAVGESHPVPTTTAGTSAVGGGARGGRLLSAATRQSVHCMPASAAVRNVTVYATQ